MGCGSVRVEIGWLIKVQSSPAYKRIMPEIAF